MKHGWRLPAGLAFPAIAWLLSAPAMPVVASGIAAQDGVKLQGRWLISEQAAEATYAGSKVLLSFSGSSSVAADITVSNTQRNRQDLYIAVTVDGGKPVRVGLSPGAHPDLVLASGRAGHRGRGGGRGLFGGQPARQQRLGARPGLRGKQPVGQQRVRAQRRRRPLG